MIILKKTSAGSKVRFVGINNVRFMETIIVSVGYVISNNYKLFNNTLNLMVIVMYAKERGSGMANMNMLKRQHEDILNVILGIRGTVKRGNLERDAANIATQISILAGKLKIHLGTEDEFMYPTLLDSSNSELVNVAREFIEEMGGISREFAEYKDCYNTKTKILNNQKGFLLETERIFRVLENRIEKEDKILYPLIEA